MAEKQKKLDPQTEVLPIVERAVCQSVGYNDTKLSKERERITRYYNGELPARQNEGRSSYVSLDVYDAVECMKSQLLETFSGNPDNLISFPPLQDNDIESSRIATEFCSFQFWRLNKGFAICNSVIDDALKARVGIVKLYWDKRHEDFEEEIPPTPFQDIQALAANDDIVELEAEETVEGSGIFTGKLTRRVDTSQVEVCNIPPEEFLISRGAKCPERALMVSHRTRKYRHELLEEGYDQKKVDEINWQDAANLDLTGEYQARHQAYSDNGYSPLDDYQQKETQTVMLYETYIKLDMHDGKGVKLYKVCHAGRVLLDIEEVDRRPFKVYTPLPVPHAFYGSNYAAKVVPTQNARTALTRAILDHAATTTNPRWGVVQGGLLNPKEMLDNRQGGIVNVKRPDAVFPLPQNNLNQAVFPTIELLKADKEQTTSISALSQGLNKDAISTQNSQGLVEDLVTLSTQRQKIMARAFADFLVEVYLEIYRLVLENASKEDVIEVAGNFEPVKVSDWVERKTCKIALHLGYGERERYANKLKANYALLAQDPDLRGMFKAENRHKMAMDALRADGMESAAEYLSGPETVEPPQPDPIKMKEADAAMKHAEASLITAQTSAKKAEADVAGDNEDRMLDKMRIMMDRFFKERDAARKDADIANKIDIGQREMTVIENAPEPNSIASPNS